MTSSCVFNQSFSKSTAATSEEGECLLGSFGREDSAKVLLDVEEGDLERKEWTGNGVRELGKSIVENEGATTNKGREQERGRERERERERNDITVEVGEEISSESDPEGTKEVTEIKIKSEFGEKQDIEEAEKMEEFNCYHEKYASLAESESTSNEECEAEREKQASISIHELNFDGQFGCSRRCFEILDRNTEVRKRSGSNSLSFPGPASSLQDLGFGSEHGEKAKMLDETFSAPDLRQGKVVKPCRCFSINEGKLAPSFQDANLHELHSPCDEDSAFMEPRRSSLNKHSLTLPLDLECRICHDTEGQDLISPCHCAGTSKWVHESCIIRWIRHTKTRQCEICTSPITVKRKKKPIDQWTRPSASCGPCNRLDIWYIFVLVLCIFIIVAFVVLQYRYDVTEQIETTVIFASIYVLCGMIIMMKVRYFWTWFVQRSSFWGNWKSLNEEWKIIEAGETDLVSPESPV